MRLIFDSGEWTYWRLPKPVQGRKFMALSGCGYHDQLLTKGEVIAAHRRYRRCFPEWAKKPRLRI